MGRSIRTIKKNTEALIVASKGTGLEVNADIKTDNGSFERLEQFKYLGTKLTNQNYIQEEIKCRLKSQNACFHSVQNLLSSSLLSENIKIKVYRTTVLLLFCKGVKLRQNKNRPAVSHCLRTVETATPVTRL